MLLSMMMVAQASTPALPATWDLSEGTRHRWVLETEVNYPGHQLVYADKNIDVRAHNLGIQVVVDCVVTDEGRRNSVLECDLSDASATGSTFITERGRLGPILEELDAKLTGATAELELSHRGEVRRIALSPRSLSPFENRRTRETNEVLRNLFRRAVAPLDLTVPRRGFPVEQWDSGDGLAFTLPTSMATSGYGTLVHEAKMHDDTRILIESKGEALLKAPGSPYLSADLSGFTVFDNQNGRVSEAVWSTEASPSASAGPLAGSYTAVSRLRAVEQDEVVTLSPSFEWATQVAKAQ